MSTKMFTVKERVTLCRMLAYMESKLMKKEMSKEYQYLFLEDDVSTEDIKEITRKVMTLEEGEENDIKRNFRCK